jgi:hypothetical protein
VLDRINPTVGVVEAVSRDLLGSHHRRRLTGYDRGLHRHARFESPAELRTMLHILADRYARA